jgi:2-polyprenyl-3-methyl-5-hydroxy-6-metoxy-1,4-benzoquinol methylase
MEQKPTEKTNSEYWSDVWKNHPLPPPIQPNKIGFNTYYYYRLHQFFTKLFSSYSHKKEENLLEIGCGNSILLPYFAKEFNLKVAGIDYSELGSENSKKILERENVKGEIYLCDAFNPPEHLLNKFDFVFSMGVVEHFTNPSDVIRDFSKFLKPGGIIITFIPNLTGLLGFMTKQLNRENYDIHFPMDAKDLKKIHSEAGLEVILNHYLVSTGFWVTLENGSNRPKLYRLKKFFILNLARISNIFNLFQYLFGSFPETKFFANNVVCVAKKSL